MNVKFKFLPNFLKTFRITRQRDNSETQRTLTSKNSHKVSAPLDLNVRVTQIQNLHLKIEQTQQTFMVASQESSVAIFYDVTIVLDSLGHGHDLTRPGHDPGRDGELKEMFC